MAEGMIYINGFVTGFLFAILVGVVLANSRNG